MSPEQPGKGLIIKADAIAESFRAEIIQGLAQCPRTLKLVGILATTSAPCRSYAEFTRKECAAVGVEFVLKVVGSALDPNVLDGEGVEEAIIEANQDGNVDGIMVYYPIFGPQQDHYLQQVVAPWKDVEGLHFKFHYNLYHNIRFLDPRSLLSSAPLSADDSLVDIYDEQVPPGKVKSIIPCTPLAIVKSLEHLGVYNRILRYGDRAYGRVITVVNRSEVVGRPLAALLANDGARVFSADIDSTQEYTKRPLSPQGQTDLTRRYYPRHVVHPCSLSLQECLALSDVVISAVPNPTYKVPTAWLKDGCICVNVAAEKNFEKDVRSKASMYLPSIGKVTITMLLRNLLRLQHYMRTEAEV